MGTYIETHCEIQIYFHSLREMILKILILRMKFSLCIICPSDRGQMTTQKDIWPSVKRKLHFLVSFFFSYVFYFCLKHPCKCINLSISESQKRKRKIPYNYKRKTHSSIVQKLIALEISPWSCSFASPTEGTTYNKLPPFLFHWLNLYQWLA